MIKRILLLLCLLAPLGYVGYRWIAQAAALRRQQAIVASEEKRERALQAKVSLYEIAGEAVPLDELLRELARQSGVAIRCDVAKFAEVNIAENAPVRVPAAEMRLGAALRLMLEPLELTTIGNGGDLLVTTVATKFWSVSARVYRLPAPLVGCVLSSDDERHWLELIQSTVAPETWEDVGGVGHLEALPGAFMAVASDDVHQRLAALLRQFEHPLTPGGRSFLENLYGPDELQIYAALAQPVSVFFQEVPLRDAMRHLQNERDIPIVLNVQKLEEAAVSVDTPVTKTLRDISLGSVLKTVLDDLYLTYVIRDGVLQITTPEDAESRTLTVVYDVSELLDGDPGERDFDPLIDLITSAVAPQSWDEVGGPGSQYGFGDSWLAFSQTQEVHIQVAALLSQLRAHLQPSASGDESLPALPGQDSPASAKARAALEREIVLDWGTMTLDELCGNLGESLGLNMACNLHRLEEVAVPASERIDCNLPKMPLWQALELLLEPLDLQAVVRDEVLQITSVEDAEAYLDTRVYEVRSFAPELARFDRLSASHDALTKVLTNSVRPESWNSVGGPGYLRRYRGLLVVSQTPAVQRQVQSVLDQLRQIAEADAENRSQPD